MKGDLKYIDDLTKMKLIDHYVEPKSNWEEFNQKFLSFESKNNLIKPASKKYTNIVVKIAIISVLIISGILLITLIPWKKTSEENTLIKHKKRIDIISKAKNIENVNSEDENIQNLKKTSKNIEINNEHVIIKKEIIIRDTFYMRDTVTIK